MKAKLLCDAGEMRDGEAVDIVTRANRADPAEAGTTAPPEYTVRDDAGHEEAVATRDLQIVR